MTLSSWPWKASPQPAQMPPSMRRLRFSSDWLHSGHQYWPEWSFMRFWPATSRPHLQQSLLPARVVLGMELDSCAARGRVGRGGTISLATDDSHGSGFGRPGSTSQCPGRAPGTAAGGVPYFVRISDNSPPLQAFCDSVAGVTHGSRQPDDYRPLTPGAGRIQSGHGDRPPTAHPNF